MDSLFTPARTAAHKPALAVFAALGTVWVFVLVALGAFTTTIGAGMVFADWPLSNGSLNPKGWVDDLSMFAEHSHRLSAGVMSIVTLILAFWLWRREERAWVRRLSYHAAVLVLVQALVGGLRVLCDKLHVDMVDTSLGRLFAMLHACLAQAFVCVLIALAVACTRNWIERPLPASPGLRRLGVICCALLFVQLAVGAIMRHSFAGLAIPFFPYSTSDHHWLPAIWNFRVGIHFAHRVMAAVLAVALVFFALRIRTHRDFPVMLRAVATLLVTLLVLQVVLGAGVVWTLRTVALTTGHVLCGALTLATTFWLTWKLHRDAIETPPEA